MIEELTEKREGRVRSDKIVGLLEGAPGPTTIFIGGIHGNEPAGLLAIRAAFENIKRLKIPVKGKVFGIAGNQWALERNQRYHKKDLNRLWTEDRMERLYRGELIPECEDEKEQLVLEEVISEIIQRESGPFFFMDLHTASSKTIPFLTLNDSLLNRRFTKRYPVPVALGIEEYLEGPILSHFNELGYVAFGFEGGQHEDPAAIENHEAFIYLTLQYTGQLAKSDFDFKYYEKMLRQRSRNVRGSYEIYYRQKVHPEDQFVMTPGYENFQVINKGSELAKLNGYPIIASRTSRVFLPLYQKEGEEGFFEIRRIHRFFLWLSAMIRRSGVSRFFTWLPGIRKTQKTGELRINRHVAWLLTKKIIHIFGYRIYRRHPDYYLVRNRDRPFRDREYSDRSKWN